MFELSENVRPYFERSGWTSRGVVVEIVRSPREMAIALLSEFSGLSVGSVGPGIELAKSDVVFYGQLKPKANEAVRAWKKQTGEVEAVATAHHDHMIIYIGTHSFYAFTDPDEQLYDLGEDFSLAMEKLLLGLSYGVALKRD